MLRGVFTMCKQTKFFQRLKSKFFTEKTNGSCGDDTDAKRKALKITGIYFLIGSVWVFFSDQWLRLNFVDQVAEVETISMAKGFSYVLITAILLFWLVHTTIKRILEAKDAVNQVNTKLEQSNQMYKELSKALRKEHALLKSLMDSIPDLIFYKDTHGWYLGCNKAYEAFTGKPEEAVVGRTDEELFPPDSAARFRARDSAMLKKKLPERVEEILVFPDGRKVYFETVETPYYGPDGELIGLIGISRDISERKKREERIQYLSYHDVLTGLYNRAFFQEEKTRLDAAEYLPLSVIMGDVNGLKLVNDAFGHMEGDRLLTRIAEALQKNSRPGDVVTRIGGDEFSILLPNTDSETAESVVTSIRDELECGRLEEKSSVCLDIALGCATRTSRNDSIDEIMVMAEDRMYRRKLMDRKSFHTSVLESLQATLLGKGMGTKEHAEQVAELAGRLGQEAGLPEKQLHDLKLTSMLHDIGEAGMDQSLLTSQGVLSEENWHEIRKHPEIGYRIANSILDLKHVAEYILCHHERWDGAGYPQGLSGETIPQISRIISIVDAYDAMTQGRAYRKATTNEQALAEIRSKAGTQFDPDLARIFVEKVMGARAEDQDAS